MSSQVIGSVYEDLCLERIPGQGKSKMCDPSLTEKNGSDISNIVAQAFREMSKLSDIAIPVSYTHLTLPTNREV